MATLSADLEPFKISPSESSQLVIQISSLPDGILELAAHSPGKSIVTDQDDGAGPPNSFCSTWQVSFSPNASLPARQYQISSAHNSSQKADADTLYVRVEYSRKIEAFRALGRILGAATADGVPSSAQDTFETLNTTEQANFDTLGVMIDCSRNAVLLVKSAKTMLRKMALMGYNMLQLYTEDTYEIKGEPFFGYLRGRYTYEELKSVDDYADNLGIEVIPCIQTLGHLAQILQWHRYLNLRDTHEVLLAGSEETYAFIRKMIEAAKAPFRSKRIHIGMDEAHGVGEGRYRLIFGHRDSTQVFAEHLHRVTDICRDLNVKPMIWSDMLFCLAARNNSLQGYYDVESNPANTEFGNLMPADLELVYWDYYHTISEIYRQKVQQHKELGCEPWMAGGAWTWNRFWCALPFTFETTRACLNATKFRDTGGVKNAMITIWGDEGNECDIFSSLPGLLYFADHGYTPLDEVDVALLKRKFAGIVGADFDAWVWASRLDDLAPENIPTDARAHFTPNMSKYLLWNEPFYSFIDPQYRAYDLEKHYASLAAQLYKSLSDRHYETPNSMHNRLEFAALIASTLALKCHLRERLRAAYLVGNIPVLRDLAQGRLMRLRRQVDQLWKFHRNMWMSTYKPFGWEVLEIRYGGLRARLETMWERIMDYIEKYENGEKPVGEHLADGDDDLRLPELEEELHEIYESARTNLILDWQRSSHPGV